MDHYKKVLQTGSAVIALALLLRFGSSLASPLLRQMSQPNTLSFLIYLETGRHVRFSPSSATNSELTGQSAPPAMQQEAALPIFTAEDAAALELRYACQRSADIPGLLCRPLQWDLTGDTAKVLIIHTHTTESYTPGPEDSYVQSAAFRTLDENYNMLRVGDRLAQLLRRQGIAVIHDRTLYDHPSYNGSYSRSRGAIEAWLDQYPEICMVLDLHRDASGDLRNQLRTALSANGTDYARLMLVMGTDAGGLYHPAWQDNLALGLKLQTQLERLMPGITRPVTLRSSRFNQDLTSGSLLIEVGAAGNSLEEALRSMEILAAAIVSLAKGSG